MTGCCSTQRAREEEILLASATFTDLHQWSCMKIPGTHLKTPCSDLTHPCNQDVTMSLVGPVDRRQRLPRYNLLITILSKSNPSPVAILLFSLHHRLDRANAAG
ncbi:hypothetical protein MUK42_27905 [Musa troglodytarum]|uniref:Uncharacterized protein n=1 Tax=Musa troglodytarum TaxID=320322 RepID=A0A9E7F656_9LILI|nr:hypothetical protein MUK42_27905 [Musa troglodytarum]